MQHWLLIEDDIDDQEIFCMALEAVDIKVKCSVANNGYDAIERLKAETSFTPNYIFLDVNMPKMNGVECLKALKQIARLKDTRILMYSTSEESKVVEQCKALGADDFIIKPPSLESLKTILSQVLIQKTND